MRQLLPPTLWLWLLAGIALLPAIFLSPYRLGLLALVASYAVASLAQNLLAGYGDVPSLGNVAFFAMSAYTAASLIALNHMAAAPAFALGLAAAGLLGLAVGLPALRISGMHLAIVTVALVFVGQELMGQWDQSHGQNGITVTGPGWLFEEKQLYIAAIIVAAFAYLAVWNILRSRSGRAILALSENPLAAASVGIEAIRYRLAVFILSGVLTGFAGLVYLYYAHTVTPGAFPIDLSLAFLTMMILGGSRSLAGSIVGALIIGLLPQLLAALPAEVGSFNIPQSVNGIYALLLLATLRFFPEGIWNVVAGKVIDPVASQLRHPRQGAETPG